MKNYWWNLIGIVILMIFAFSAGHAFEDGYDAGWDHGYTSGYEDGYNAALNRK